MVLRLYQKDCCVKIYVNVNGLVCNKLGQIEFHYDKDNDYQWKIIEREKDYDSFILAVE